MRIILNNVPITTAEGDSVTITTSMSDPIPTCTLNVRDDTSSLSITGIQELIVIDDQVTPNPTSNLVVNPSLNPYTSDWSATPATGMTLSQIGGGGVKITCANATPGGTNVLINGVGNFLQSFFVPGQTYMGSVYVQGSSTPTNIRAYLQINWYDAAFNNLQNDFFLGPNPVSTSLVRYQVQTTAPANAGFAEMVLGVQPTNATNSGAISYTQAQLEPMWFPSEITYPSTWCGPNQTGCKQIPGSLTWIRQYRKFAGYVNHAVAQNYHGNARTWTIDAVGYAWLCSLVLGTQNYSGQADSFVFSNLLNNFFTAQFNVGSNVLTGVTLSSLQLNYDDPRTIFDALCGQTGWFWTVDPYWEVFYQPPGYTTMPISLICDDSSNPDLVTTFPAYNFSAEMDYTQPGSLILVIGSGSNVAEVIDPNVASTFQNIQLFGNGNGQIFMRKVNDSNLANIADCTQRGIAELLQYDMPRNLYHLTTNQELIAGQGIAVTSKTDGLNATTLLIQQVQAKWIGTDETLTDVWEYQADLGAVNRGATNILSHIFRSGNTNTSAPAITTTTLATFENVGLTDTTATASVVTSYVQTVQGDTPIAYYRLSNLEGTTADDWSGNNNKGTTHGSPTLGVATLLTDSAAGDTSDFAMTFAAASSQYISLPTSMIPTGSGHAWSIEAWARIASIPANGNYVVITWGANTTNNLGQIRLTSNGTTAHFDFLVFGTDLNSANISAATTYHLVGTYDGTNLRFYINGSLAVGPTAATVNLSATAAQIGAASGPGSYFTGTIDEAAFYTFALSSTQVTNHYNAGT